MIFNFLFGRAVLIALLLAAANVIAIAQKPAISAPRQERLLNGLKVIAWNDPSAANAIVKIRIHSGAAFDPQGKEGVMNMLAENLFPTEAVREFYRTDLGGSLEVVTTYDYIQINATASNDQLLPLLESVASAVLNPAIDKETTAQLRASQLAKIAAARKDPGYIADSAGASRLFGTFPYGRPKLGTVESVGKIDQIDLADQKLRFLTADNATVGVYGNVEPNIVFRAARRYFGGWLKSERPVPSTFRQPDPPKQDLAVFDSPVAGRSEFRIAIRGAGRGEKGYYASLLLAAILDNRFKQTERGMAFVRLEANTLPGMYLFGVSDWNSGRIKRIGGAVAAPVIDNYRQGALQSDIKTEEFETARRELAASFAKPPTIDSWLDAETYKLGSPTADRDNAQAVTIADVQRVLTRLRTEPAAYVLVFSEPARASSN